jgi:hypothetical protein
MSRSAILSLLTVFIFTTSASSLYAQHYVAEQPQRPHATTTKPQSTRQGYVWVEEDWKWAHGKYIWAGDRWTVPPYQGAGWSQGHWKKNEHGWYWVQGHWIKNY